MTSFAGWQMPLRYGSETAEHRAVRHAAGLFDLSHMGEILVRGPGAGAALDYALTGQLSAAPPGRARYTMICAPDGGVLDDLVVYRQGEQDFLVIANAANTAVVFGELRSRAAGFDATVTDATQDYALIAIQGPAAAGILGPLTGAPSAGGPPTGAPSARGLPAGAPLIREPPAGPGLAGLKYYAGAFGDVAGRPAWVARTGYTGEDGFEVFCRPADATAIWDALASAGAPAGLVPAGLAARDTLRLEAGMPLYGNELGPGLTPFEAGLGRVVKFDKPGDFVGRSALRARAAAGPRQVLAGLTLQSRRVARHGYPVFADGKEVGTVTSGAPSPTLGQPIAMAYLAADTDAHDAVLTVGIRGEAVPAELTELPFYSRSR
jgi:aminomethyltransferase